MDDDPIVTPQDEPASDGFAGDALHDLSDITDDQIAKGNEWGSEDEPDFILIAGQKVYLDDDAEEGDQ